jgi:glycogen debranching enzyme
LSQPPLHEHITCIAAPATWLSPRSGQLTGGVDGLYVADRRVLSQLIVTIDGAEPAPVGSALRGADRARFVAHAGSLTVERLRVVTPDGGTEHIVLHNRGDVPVSVRLEVTAATDLAPISEVKDGADGPPRRVRRLRDGAVHADDDGYEVRLDGATSADPVLAPGERFTTTLAVRAAPPPSTGFRQVAPAAPAPWSRAPLAVRSPDPRLAALVARGVEDLAALLLADGDDVYCAAGSPWYLTLFGRDSLWTARMALPLGHELAAGTLRALARYQGTRHDPVTEEEPGRIPHELRPAHATNWLPPVYYGTVDATALFVITLAEAWRWGMPAPRVEALLPAAERALDWLETFEEFVSYRGSPDRLVNQGWKDSRNGVQHRDGTLATPPVALSEVQAYAFQAAMEGADLLAAFGRPGGDRHRRWAGALAERFRARFWVDGYPAIALDGDGRPVDGPASNIGHLFGTGLLTEEEEVRLAGRLMELDSGYGLRTLTDQAAGYDPLSYHVGSVWPHDTAIAMLGLARAGRREAAARLAEGLIGSSAHFEHRLPEPFGGQDSTAPPVPYPPACRPQAWAAAVSPALVTALLGLKVDVPAGTMTVSPLPGVTDLSVDGLRVGDASLSVHVDRGAVSISGAPGGLRIG